MGSASSFDVKEVLGRTGYRTQPATTSQVDFKLATAAAFTLSLAQYMKRPRKRDIIIWVLVVLACIAVPVYRWVFPPAHQHCMKQAVFIFLGYAIENGGQYPESERGWGDALLKFGSADDTESWIPYIVGIDDDGSHLIEALKRGTDVNEARCTRVYVQGLSEKSFPGTAILFDRDSEPGGDHFRYRFSEPLREVLTVGGSHEMIKDRDWPDYVKKQKQLLRDQGFDEAKINEVYGQYK